MGCKIGIKLGEMVLTGKGILEDIKEFSDRVRIARRRLEALPPEGSTYKGHKKVNEQRRKIQWLIRCDMRRIRRFQGLIVMADEDY